MTLAQTYACPLRWLVGVGLVLTALVLICFDPGHYRFYPQCIFHQTTGLLCPGCGSLRALHQLLCGHLATAFRFNPLLVVGFPLVLGAYAWRRGRSQRGTFTVPLWWLWLGFALAVAFGVWRNLPGYPWPLPPP